MARGFSHINHILLAGLVDSRPLIIATRRSNYSHFTILGTKRKLSIKWQPWPSPRVSTRESDQALKHWSVFLGDSLRVLWVLTIIKGFFFVVNTRQSCAPLHSLTLADTRGYSSRLPDTPRDSPTHKGLFPGWRHLRSPRRVSAIMCWLSFIVPIVLMGGRVFSTEGFPQGI